MHVELNGQRLWFQVTGNEQGSAVVLIMGFGMSGRAWQPQLEDLGRHHRVIIFDNRGIGDSDASVAPYGFTDLASDVVGLLDHLHIDKAHVVGVSMGGMVAQHVAINHPSRLLSLSLIATFACGSPRFAWPTWKGLKLFARANTIAGDARFSALRRLLYSDVFLQQQAPESSFSSSSLTTFAVPAPRSTKLRQLRAVMQHDARQGLAKLQLPALIIQPRQDLLVRPANSDRLHAIIPSSRLVSFDHAGHGVTHECASEVNRTLLEHFAASTRATQR
jgi:3-oxoadipate enol-lactonase